MWVEYEHGTIQSKSKFVAKSVWNTVFHSGEKQCLFYGIINGMQTVKANILLIAGGLNKKWIFHWKQISIMH